MHSTDIEVEGEPFTVHHNGDYSGDLMIDLSPERVAVGATRVRVDLPFEVMKVLVGQYMISRAISSLEQTEPATFIDGVEW